MICLGLVLGWAVNSWGSDHWGAAHQVSNSSGAAQTADLTQSSDHTLHLISLDDRTSLPLLYYQRQTSGASTWSAPQLISNQNASLQAGLAVLRVDQGQGVYAAWEEWDNGGVNIYYAHSQDLGQTWSAPVLIAGSTTSAAHTTMPDLVVDAQHTLHIVYLDESSHRAYYRKGSVDATALSNPQVLANNAASAGIGEAGNGLIAYPKWTTNEVYYRRSLDHGDNWGSSIPTGLTTTARPGMAGDVSGSFYLAAGTGAGIELKKYDALLGLLPARVSISTSSLSGDLSVALTQAQVAVAWTTGATGNMQVHCRTSLDQGFTWANEAMVQGGYLAEHPRLVGDRDNYWIAYDQAPQNGILTQVDLALRDSLAPAAPLVSSSTNPAGQPTGNNRPVIFWSASDNPGGSGLAGYAFVLDQQASTDPGSTTRVSSSVLSMSYPSLGNGNYIFHIRAIDQQGNLGSITHYLLGVDAGSFCPADQAWVAPSPIRNGKLNLRFFLTKPCSVRLEFFTAAGRKLSQYELNGILGVNLWQGEVTDWVNGAYFFRLTARAADESNQAIVTKAFVVMR